MTTPATTPVSSPYRKTPSSTISTPKYVQASRSRLQSLYSDFSRQKTSNPASYNANIEWWHRSLEKYVSNGAQGSSRLVLQAGNELIESYRVQGVGKPIGLGAVITELVTPSSSDLPPLYPISSFLSLPNSIYSSKSKLSYVSAIPGLFLSYMVAKPLWWALEQVGVVGEDSIASSISSTFSSSSRSSRADISWFGDYVFLKLVEQTAEAIIEKQASKAVGPSDGLYTFDGFKKDFSDCLGPSQAADEGSDYALMSDVDMKVLLRYLERDKEAVVTDGEIIKFVDATGSLERVSEITTVDRGILELKTAIEDLHAQVDGIHKKIDQCTSKATDALRLKRKSLALSYLRSRKQLEDLLTKRLGALQNLEGTLISVEGAAGDIEILKTYESSTSTLRSILSHPSLQRESIEKTMDALAEANADAKEVDEAVRIGGDVALGVEDIVDESELEAELRGLIEEEKVESEKQNDKKDVKALDDLRDKLSQLQTPTDGREPEEASRNEERDAVMA
ncbi:hypothetical protein D9758_005328 [Tetrapyrgos nigripes]|uniref:Charged multivesicular body protein 7 n=1 Tax=Tetrapyrgos nigripes TaxID=182062 RepID=A0A8H5GHL4_9AGAR|nr:hypothetical protein D9758_005328 [Tetrapyrgos nigripes]